MVGLHGAVDRLVLFVSEAPLWVIETSIRSSVLVSEAPFWCVECSFYTYLASVPPLMQDSVTVVGYPIGGDTISVTSGVVSRIEVTSYAHGSSELLGVQIDAAINAGNSGGPAFNEAGHCVGIAFQSLKNEDAENIGYVIPTPVIKHFITDFERNGSYTGFPILGIEWQKMENPQLRKALGMTVSHQRRRAAALLIGRPGWSGADAGWQSTSACDEDRPLLVVGVSCGCFCSLVSAGGLCLVRMGHLLVQCCLVHGWLFALLLSLLHSVSGAGSAEGGSHPPRGAHRSLR
jgi:hypothetical protein